MERKKVLIAYATKGGTTAQIAQWLAEGMEEADVDVLAVGDVRSLDHDLIVLGAPIRIWKVHPGMVEFMEQHREELRSIPKVLFVVCLFSLLSRGYLKKMREHVEGEIVNYRVFFGKMGIINMMDRDYAVEAGKNILSQAFKS